MVSRKMGMRSLRGTAVEPPKPGLKGISFGATMRMRKRGPRDKAINKIVTFDSSTLEKSEDLPIYRKYSHALLLR